MGINQEFSVQDFDNLSNRRELKINNLIASIPLKDLEDEINDISVVLSNMNMSLFEDKLLECESHRDRCLQIETDVRQIKNYIDDSISQLTSLGLLFANGKSKEIREAQVLSWLISFFETKSVIDELFIKISNKRSSLDKKMEVLSRWLTAETSMLHINPRKEFYNMQKDDYRKDDYRKREYEDSNDYESKNDNEHEKINDWEDIVG